MSRKARLPEGAPWSFGKYQENDRALKEVPDTVPGVVLPSNVARPIGLRGVLKKVPARPHYCFMVMLFEGVVCGEIWTM